jgi:hypothetical protein
METSIIPTDARAISAAQIETGAANILADCKNGDASALKTLVQATQMDRISKAILTPELRALAASEVEKYPKGDRTYLGCKLEIRAVKGAEAKYDFNGVREWRAIQDQINELLAEIEMLSKPINERIEILELRQKEVEKTSITGLADADGFVHETAIVVKEATKSSKTVAVTIL